MAQYDRVKQADGTFKFVPIAEGTKKGKSGDGKIPAWAGLFTWPDADVIACENIMVEKENLPKDYIEELRKNTNSEDETVRRSARGERTRNLNKILEDGVKAYIASGTPAPRAPVPASAKK